MVDVYLATARRDGAADDRVGSQQIEPDGSTNDINDRVDGADLVKVHLVDC